MHKYSEKQEAVKTQEIIKNILTEMLSSMMEMMMMMTTMFWWLYYSAYLHDHSSKPCNNELVIKMALLFSDRTATQKQISYHPCENISWWWSWWRDAIVILCSYEKDFINL